MDADTDIKITGLPTSIQARCPACKEVMEFQGWVRWRVLLAALEEFARAHWWCLNPTLQGLADPYARLARAIAAAPTGKLGAITTAEGIREFVEAYAPAEEGDR